MRTPFSHISGGSYYYITGPTTYVRGESTHLMYSQNILLFSLLENRIKIL